MVMDKCLRSRAAYVLAPCCVGKIKLSALEYPRSRAFAQQLTRTEYEVLAKAADFGHNMSHAVAQTETNQRRRQCKSMLESDRNQRAREAQYETFMFVMHPHDATPKNDILVGIPQPTEQDTTPPRGFAMSCSQPLSAALTNRALFGG